MDPRPRVKQGLRTSVIAARAGEFGPAGRVASVPLGYMHAPTYSSPGGASPGSYQGTHSTSGPSTSQG
jgi:hypothetical protein